MDKAVLLRYITGEASGSEKSELISWLDANPDNMREFMALRKLYDMTLWHEIPERKITGIGNIRRLTVKRILAEVVKVAAILILGYLIFNGLVKEKPMPASVMQTIHVPPGQRAEVILADGTHVWLNANTRFIFPTLFRNGMREVELDGEGYFDVAHHATQPFIVTSCNFEIKALGTEFNVLAYKGKNRFEVSLLSGSVEVTRSGAGKGVILKPDQKLFLRDKQLFTSEITHQSYYLWKEGIISFDDESFPEMVRKLELYFDLNIAVENDKILMYRCTGKFRSKDGVEHILKVLQLSNKFNYSIDDKLNRITIR